MKAGGLGGCSCWEVRAERGGSGDTEKKESQVEGNVDTCPARQCAAGRDTSILHTVCTPPLSFTSCYSSVSSSHTHTFFFFKKISSCILVKLGQHPYNVLLNRQSNNWFMLCGITRSCRLLPVLVGTEGPVCQRLLKLIVSEFQHQAYSMLPGFTCQQTEDYQGRQSTAQPHTLTQPPPEALWSDSTTEDKGMGSIWPGITAFKKKKNGTVKRVCMTAPRSKQHGNGIAAKTTLIWC